MIGTSAVGNGLDRSENTFYMNEKSGMVKTIPYHSKNKATVHFGQPRMASDLPKSNLFSPSSVGALARERWRRFAAFVPPCSMENDARPERALPRQRGYRHSKPYNSPLAVPKIGGHGVRRCRF